MCDFRAVQENARTGNLIMINMIFHVNRSFVFISKLHHIIYEQKFLYLFENF